MASLLTRRPLVNTYTRLRECLSSYRATSCGSAPAGGACGAAAGTPLAQQLLLLIALALLGSIRGIIGQLVSYRCFLHFRVNPSACGDPGAHACQVDQHTGGSPAERSGAVLALKGAVVATLAKHINMVHDLEGRGGSSGGSGHRARRPVAHRQQQVDSGFAMLRVHTVG